MIITVPLTLSYLGSERFGLWSTISSLIPMLGFADLGMGLGVMNAIAESHGKDDPQAAIQIVSNGCFMLSGIALIIMALFMLSYPFIPWDRIFNVKTIQAVQEAGPGTLAFMACFALNLPLRLVQRVQLGYQEGFFNSLWESLGRLLALGGLLLVIYWKGGLVWLVLALAGAPALALILNGISLFGLRRPWLRPRWKYFSIEAGKKLLRVGICFFILQFGVSVIHSADNLIAAQLLGPEAVTEYALPYRMFSLFIVITGVLVFPLWPAYGEALSRGETAWVRKTLVRSVILLLLCVGLPSLAMVAVGNYILHLWVGPAVSASFPLLLGLGVWTLILPVGHAISMLLNAANIFRIQIICTILTIISSLVAKVILVKFYGLPGIIWGGIIAYSLFFLIPYCLFVRTLLARFKSEEILRN
jgi:O-antigen/teichoic acid export membrane protein